MGFNSGFKGLRHLAKSRQCSDQATDLDISPGARDCTLFWSLKAHPSFSSWYTTVKWSEREANHSPSSNIEFKDQCSCTYNLPYTRTFLVCRGENLTSYVASRNEAILVKEDRTECLWNKSDVYIHSYIHLGSFSSYLLVFLMREEEILYHHWGYWILSI